MPASRYTDVKTIQADESDSSALYTRRVILFVLMSKFVTVRTRLINSFCRALGTLLRKALLRPAISMPSRGIAAMISPSDGNCSASHCQLSSIHNHVKQLT